MKEWLAKKFKREKEFVKKAKEKKEVDEYTYKIKEEKTGETMERKKRADE